MTLGLFIKEFSVTRTSVHRRRTTKIFILQISNNKWFVQWQRMKCTHTHARTQCIIVFSLRILKSSKQNVNNKNETCAVLGNIRARDKWMVRTELKAAGQ